LDKLTREDRQYFISEITTYQDKLFIPIHRDSNDYLSSLDDNKLFHYYIANLDLYTAQRY